MDDSEINRSLPTNTRRNLLSLVTTFLAAQKTHKNVLFGLTEGSGDDATITTWERWHDAREHENQLSRRQQLLENKLLQTVGGFPRVELIVPSRPAPIFAATTDEIDRLLPGFEMEEARSTAKMELARIRNAWDAADSDLGYSAACAAENKASGHALDLAEALWQIPALSIPDVLAKLHCLIEMEEPGASLRETPWPELRSILFDLLHLAKR
ncbi:hypothetical protein PY650_30310 [Rhizobium calliandrae]|uniref:Uncharacterized protein n=1 Tax=Rhizobium calliandrae TaxID=1312182 RepID=A0ABT7KMJ7_9HYPH|nr:hypothetical protein [Rhizobium calliandrae]MDL2409839.1 hypothetical protein [Rhizobium calliandrae]